MRIRSKSMPESTVVVIISGMEKAEKESIAKKIRETIQKENRLKTEKILYQINY